MLRPVRSSAVRRRPLAGEKDDVPAGCVMRTRNHAGTAARRRGHVATETGQAEDRRPVEPFGIGSITAPLNIDREDPCLPPHPAAERIGRRRWRSSPPRKFVVIMDTSIIGVAA